MEQLELQINRLSNTNLSKFGYQLPSMSKQQETRFSAIMIEAAKVDKMHKNKRKPKAGGNGSWSRVSTNIALNMAKNTGTVNADRLASETGLKHKSAGNVLTSLRRQGLLVVCGEPRKGYKFTWTLTDKGREMLKQE